MNFSLDELDNIIQMIKKLLKRKNPVLIALDGRSGVGKSSISKAIASKIEAVVLVSDDFYSGGEGGSEEGWDDKTPQEKVSLVIDWKRMRKEALEPLLKGQMASYHPFNFKQEHGLSDKFINLKPAPVIILDGAYSTKPELADLIDIKILVKAPKKEREMRLLQREGQNFMLDWHKRWDEAEDYYFSNIQSRISFDYVIKN